MIIGVDFDNTIVCYDDLFQRVAFEQGLIPACVPATKSAVRSYLEERGQGDVWTELQGYVYGVRLPEAALYPGVLEFFGRCTRMGLALYIISHKTLYPALGPPYDLHQAAQQWLKMQGFYDPKKIGLSQEQVYFELTQQEKVDRIVQVGCSVFIDDLPEVLMKPGFPANVKRILFDPHGRYAKGMGLYHTTSWTEIEQLIRCNNPLS
ncbi:MAG TPA: hypothetical protein VGY77_07975 [Gemmataceae bacterium]|jgi:FMN phosphatase YigB (HAD superfamily)|nr:hypothetical protein [Gemmataceae bacterium]